MTVQYVNGLVFIVKYFLAVYAEIYKTLLAAVAVMIISSTLTLLVGSFDP